MIFWTACPTTGAPRPHTERGTVEPYEEGGDTYVRRAATAGDWYWRSRLWAVTWGVAGRHPGSAIARGASKVLWRGGVRGGGGPRAPLDVIVVRKLGVPFQPELGFGALGEGGVRVINDDVVRLAELTQAEIVQVEERERAELGRRARRFRGDRPSVELTGRTVIVVDDGIATGGTARAACQVVRARGARPHHVIVGGHDDVVLDLNRSRAWFTDHFTTYVD